MAKVKPDETPRKSAASGAGSKYGRRPSGSLLRQPLGQPVVIVDRQRRVVGEPLRLVDRLLPRLRCNARRGDLVIDAPADVLFPRLAAIRPPRVLVGLAIQLAKDVDEAQLIEYARQPGALFGQETRIFLVRLPVPEVDLLVGDVPVAAKDDFAVSLF